MGNRYIHNWTPERCDLLKKLWADGLSASKIANELGGVSRSAVLGLAYRMELPKRKTITSVCRDKPNPRGLRWSPRPQMIRFPKEIVPPPDFIGIPFLETSSFTCMYPEGEGRAMMFCGQPRKDGSSFCLGHHRVCYHRPTPNKRNNYEQAA